LPNIHEGAIENNIKHEEYKYTMKTLLPLLALALLLTGCTTIRYKTEPPSAAPAPSPTAENPETLSEENICISACKLAKARGSIDSGPCLLNPMKNTDWVCDVAHEPRIETDNQQENQCSAYREGKARHFVEVSADCKLINKV